MITFPLAVVISATDKWTAPLAKMQASVNKTLAPLRELGAKAGALAEASGLSKIASGFKGVAAAGQELVSSLLSGFLKVGAVLAGIGFTLWHIVGDTAKAGAGALRAAGRIGVGVEKYQELAYAARFTGLEQAELDTSLQKFVRTMGQVALGNKSANQGFRRLGVNVFDVNHKLRPVEEVLGEVGDRLNELDDPLKRTAITALLFGRQGAKLAGFLKLGSKGFADMAKEARELGVVLSKTDAEASREFLHAWHRVHEALDGVRNVIGIALLPAFEELAVHLKEFLVAHRVEIAEWSRKFAAGLPEKLEKLAHLFKQLVDGLLPLVEMFLKLVDVVGPVPVLLGGLAAVIAVSVVPAVLSLVASLVTLSGAIVATPAGWIILAIAAVVLSVSAFVASILYLLVNWKEVWSSMKYYALAFSIWWDYQTDRLLAPVRWIEEKWSELPNFFRQLWADVESTIPDWVKSVAGLAADVALAPAYLAQNLASRVVGSGGASPGGSSTHVKVEFANAPPGLRVSEAGNSGVDLDLSLGYSNLDF